MKQVRWTLFKVFEYNRTFSCSLSNVNPWSIIVNFQFIKCTKSDDVWNRYRFLLNSEVYKVIITYEYKNIKKRKPHKWWPWQQIFLQWERKEEVFQPKHLPLRYTACDVGLTKTDHQPNSWLISGQIAVNKANRIDITVEYLIKSCFKFPPKGGTNGGYFCVDMFDLYVNQSDQLIADSSRYPNPLNNTAAYENVAEMGKATSVRTSKTMNVLIKGKHVILAFHNYGCCSILYSVKVKYNVCPEETDIGSLVSLPRTVAPANDSESLQVEGYCGEDTVKVPGSLYVHCKGNGEWNTSGLEGRCICKEDTQNVGGECQGMLFLSHLQLITDCVFQN